MKISVIISTYNSPEWLQKVLWGYEVQDDRNFEILIADDGSTAENQTKIKDCLKSSKLDTNYLWQKDDGFQKCKILNKAISAAKGEYLVFTDGDCIPFPGFVSAHRRLAQPGFFLSGGYSKLPMELSKKINRERIASGECFNLSWLSKNGLPLSRTWLKIGAAKWGLAPILNRLTPAKRTFNGNNSSCFTADALRVNGYDERMRYGGEDREFGYRLENAGVKPKGIRYSAPCLHLDHPRGYVNPLDREKNNEIIAASRTNKTIWTNHGIKKK